MLRLTRGRASLLASTCFSRACGSRPACVTGGNCSVNVVCNCVCRNACGCRSFCGSNSACILHPKIPCFSDRGGARPNVPGCGSLGNSNVVSAGSHAVVKHNLPVRANNFAGSFRCGKFSLDVFFR